MAFTGKIVLLFFVVAGLFLQGCNEQDPVQSSLQIEGVTIGDATLDLDDSEPNTNVAVDEAVLITFSSPLDQRTITSAVSLLERDTQAEVEIDISFPTTSSISISPEKDLKKNTEYDILIIDALKGQGGESFTEKTITFKTIPDVLKIESLTVDGVEALQDSRVLNVSRSGFTILATFSEMLDERTVTLENIRIIRQGTPIAATLSISEDKRTITLVAEGPLAELSKYDLILSTGLASQNGEKMTQYVKSIFTEVNPTPDFPIISDEELLTLVQQQTFKYFYDFAHPASGMARERNSSGDLVTTGGTGFGLMALIVAIERNFISRQEGMDHFNKVLNFLETADKFHGVWSHWVNGNTGKALPFSTNDNGGDLVETSFLVQGLLTFRQYLDASVPTEQELINRVNTLWEGVEWDWYTQGGQNVLYWHWSPDKGWIMNHQIKGYNEALITYVLAASSPTHPIEEEVYHQGWASNGNMRNGRMFYNITLPLGFDYGGPLFFSHYSFLGLDPRNLTDTYGNYWEQNVNHSLINQAHAIANPKNFAGYSAENWGFTASDNQQGYNAHSPTNDLGVISPTAALSSFPYTPEESRAAMRFFYYTLGDRLWGPYGFYDAFNVTENWFANSYLAIDQGPIVVMIENYRTGLLWDLFMSAPEVQAGLTKLGFTY